MSFKEWLLTKEDCGEVPEMPTNTGRYAGKIKSKYVQQDAPPRLTYKQDDNPTPEDIFGIKRMKKMRRR